MIAAWSVGATLGVAALALAGLFLVVVGVAVLVIRLGARTRGVDGGTSRVGGSLASALLAVGVLLLVGAGIAVQEHDDGPRLRPGERIAVYVPLESAVLDLCVPQYHCGPREKARALRTYERAQAVALRSPATSSEVRRSIAVLERALVAVHRHVEGAFKRLVDPVDLLYGAVQEELLAEHCGRSCQHRSVAALFGAT
jgi:hypothetical protein